MAVPVPVPVNDRALLGGSWLQCVRAAAMAEPGAFGVSSVALYYVGLIRFDGASS